MNAKISLFIVYVEAIIYLLLYNLHDCAFKVGLPPFQKICFIWFNKIPLKMVKYAFFHLKSSFRSQDI